MTQLQVHNFSNGILNPGIGYLMSCLGAFLGLRCLTRARAYTGRTRALWLLLASVAIGATGIWVMHFVGMSAMSMQGTIRYNLVMVGVSVIIAIVAGTAALVAGLRVGGVWSSIAVSLVMGVAVTGMHYTGMAAMHVDAGGSGTTVSGYPADSFLFPLLLGASVLTFVLSLIIAMSPNEDEIRADAALSERLAPEPAAEIEQPVLGDRWESFVSLVRRVWPVGGG